MNKKKTNNYELLDCGWGRKVESFGGLVLDRPSPQALWPSVFSPSLWESQFGVFARYERGASGKGSWAFSKKGRKPKLSESVSEVLLDGVRFDIRLTEFGHVGIFPEHRLSWEKASSQIRTMLPDQGQNSHRPVKVLNLFAYTGGASLAAAAQGAQVTHVDASKTTIAWAKDNQILNKLQDKPIRWICDDVLKFCRREVRRKQVYDVIILDPPSFGRGTQNEVWKLEEHLGPLLETLDNLWSRQGFVLLSSHSLGMSPKTLEQILGTYFSPADGSRCQLECGEMLIHQPQGRIYLTSGSFALLKSEG